MSFLLSVALGAVVFLAVWLIFAVIVYHRERKRVRRLIKECLHEIGKEAADD